jgi:hypothetical protein
LINIYLPDSSLADVFQAALSLWFRSNQQTLRNCLKKGHRCAYEHRVAING